jgi:protein TonB
MTGPTMPSARRRFLVTLWLSLALHALVIGFARLPPSVKVPLPAEFNVVIAEPVPALPHPAEPSPVAEPVAAARPPSSPQLRLEASAPQAVALPLPPAADPAPPQPVAGVSPQPVPVREPPGPVLDVPLLADTRYYLAKELDVQPMALRRPEPIYPPRAEEQGVAGRVLVRLRLEADGSISKTEVVSVTPAGAYGDMFRQATLEALRAVRFRPARRGGQPVRAVVEIPVVFEPDS